jgi:hypothetical protein
MFVTSSFTLFTFNFSFLTGVARRDSPEVEELDIRYLEEICLLQIIFNFELPRPKRFRVCDAGGQFLICRILHTIYCILYSFGLL